MREIITGCAGAVPCGSGDSNVEGVGIMEHAKSGADVLFILLGGIMVLAMHSGFAFLELGTVRWKNQVNALVKILADFAVSTIAYFFIGYGIAYGVGFLDRKSTRLNSSHLVIS